MKISLNKKALEWAKKIIEHHEVDVDAKNWQECAPTPDEVDHYIDTHDMEEYGQWFLGINDDIPAHMKEHYIYPLGDLKLVHRSALLISQQQASRAHHKEIEQAAQHLLDLINKKMPNKK